MDKYELVPMTQEPAQFPAETYFSTEPQYRNEQPTPEYIKKLLINAIRQERNKNNYKGFVFDYAVRPDRFVESLRSKDPYNFYGKGAGTFSVSELNDLLRRDYDSSLYNLGQAKDRATATQNILKAILGQ